MKANNRKLDGKTFIENAVEKIKNMADYVYENSSKSKYLNPVILAVNFWPI